MNPTNSELSIENKNYENDGTLGQINSGRELQSIWNHKNVHKNAENMVTNAGCKKSDKQFGRNFPCI